MRFIAAFLVIIHHIEKIKSIYKLENYWGSIKFIGIIGKLGVVLFFVLSEFLITYLLLAEEKTFKKISIKKFYMRRVLRIWPLYFLIIFLAFWVLTKFDIFLFPGYSNEQLYTNLVLKLVFFLLFFPNLVLIVFGIVPYASQTWSIGTEEQFYLVWPLILSYFKKNRVLLMVMIIILYFISKIFLISSYSSFLPYRSTISAFMNTFRIDCMAIGAFFSVLLFEKKRVLTYFLRNDLFYFCILLAIICMLFGVSIPYFQYEFYAVLFGIIILNFSANTKIKISFEYRFLNYLGSISYGLYMFHPIGIVLAITIGNYFELLTNWFFYPLSFLITILISAVSYKYFESFFLKFKNRFSNVASNTMK